ncbi:hypothetical protein EON79_04410 [bacterium]|nr:MAG: hypothetical protein EON79_04410 [bacterium]
MSVLRHFRHLHDIPGFVDDESGRQGWGTGETPKSERIMAERRVRLHQAWCRSKANVPEELATYVNGAQHDAWILGHSREGDRFTLTASDESTILLAIWGFGVPWRECLFPFDFVFEGVTYVGWRAVQDGHGTLRWASPPRFPRTNGVSWLSDTFIESDGPGLQWALHFWQGDERHSNRLLLVEAKSMKVVERQRKAWKGIVGERSLPLFDDFFAHRHEFLLTSPEKLHAFLRERGLPKEGRK